MTRWTRMHVRLLYHGFPQASRHLNGPSGVPFGKSKSLLDPKPCDTEHRSLTAPRLSHAPQRFNDCVRARTLTQISLHFLCRAFVAMKVSPPPGPASLEALPKKVYLLHLRKSPPSFCHWHTFAPCSCWRRT